MNKELARTLTTALVNYIDENRPEGTMDCSSCECVSLEKAFTEENFDSVETFIKKKLSMLTEFELRLLDWMSSDTSGEIPMERMEKVVKNRAAILLAIAKKEILKDLPRWESGYKPDDYPAFCIYSHYVYVGDKRISVPDLEKLPGFKEEK